MIDFGELGFVGALVGLEAFHEGAAFDSFVADLFLVFAQAIEFFNPFGDFGDGGLDGGLAGLLLLQGLGGAAELVEAAAEAGGGAIDVALQLLLALQQGDGLELGLVVVLQLGAGLVQLG